ARYRRAALACAAGAVLVMLGLAGLTLTVDIDGSPVQATLSALAIIVGSRLPMTGADRAGDGPSEPAAADLDDTFAGYPLLLVPLVGALVAVAYHAVVGGRFDTVSIALGGA